MVLANKISLVVFDFDGVMTDNGVWLDQNGMELVRCDRSDGLGISQLHELGVAMLVLSTEANPVVAARCAKLKLPVQQGISDKGVRLREILRERAIDAENVAYIGNDVNDSDCLRMVGTAVVVKDAHPDVVPLADHVLERPGGHGAVREFCDLLVARSDALLQRRGSL
jgi:YrbI family 3-deoxy-D-manno-octulosonate 8-phosphate phosphatase